MGFWSFGARKKSRLVDGQDQGHNTLLEKDQTTRSGNLSPSQSREFASMARQQSKTDRSEPRRLSKQRNSSQQGSVPRSVTMPVSSPRNDSRATRRTSDLYSHNPMS